MRCLHCGKELALFKRLTGGGEFCSEAHKKSYQEEYNRIALSRLLQAQKVVKPTQEAATRADKAPTPETSVAVEETVEAPAPAEVELHAIGMAGLCMEPPSGMSPPAEVPACEEEPWLEPIGSAMAPDFLFDGERKFILPHGELVALSLVPPPRDSESTRQEVTMPPTEFTGEVGNLPATIVIRTNSALGSAGPVALKVAPCLFTYRIHGVADSVGFAEGEAEYSGSPLLDQSPLGVSFPAEDADVEVEASVVREAEPTLEASEPDAAVEESIAGLPESADAHDDAAAKQAELEATPRESLEALARLHQEMAASAEVPAEHEPTPAAETAPAAVVENVPAAAEEQLVAVGAAEAVAEEQRSPRQAEVQEIAVRTFGPAKPIPVDGGPLVREAAALLPRLTGLPLRPKVALAPSQAASQAKATPAKGQTSTADSSRAANGAQARESQGKAPGKSAPGNTPGQAGPKAPVKPLQTVKLQTTAGKGTPGVMVSSFKKGEKPATGPAAEVAEKPKKETPKEITPQEAAPKVAVPAEKPEEKAMAAAAADDTAVPTFGATQLSSSSFLGSLKVKLGIAILLVAGCATTYFGWGAKYKNPAVPAAGADAPGPSIMVGEGGWVEGWGGDPTGAHYGRQIMIYRPSLKLSDYRMEFQAQIDTKSIGWVFRAANPENYYAMKLAQVSSGGSPALALFKYMVANGRQTQVGRVPVELAVRPDTMFSIRVDVRGPRFTTYVQGQQVDVWTDDQLKAGGVGFLNERDERSRVKSVSIYYLNGGTK